MKISLSKLNFLNILFATLIFSISLGFIIVNFNNSLLEKRINEVHNNFYKKNENLVRNEIKKEISRIKTLRNSIFEKNESFLKEKVNLVEKLFTINDSKTDIKQLIIGYKTILDSFHWDEKTGYIYIFDEKGDILYHPFEKSLKSKNIFENNKDRHELIKFFSQSIKVDSYYDSYLWEKPSNDNNTNTLLDEKYVYVKKNKRNGIYIAAGSYKSEIDKKVLNLVYDNIVTARFGENNYGYFWIHGFDYMVRVHPTRPEYTNTSIKNFKGLDGKKVFIEMNEIAKNGGGFSKYRWYRPDNLEVDQKVSYVAQIADYPLVLGAGFYLSELEELISKEKEELKIMSNAYTKDILIVLIILTLITLFVTNYISHKIHLIEEKDKEHLYLLQQYKMLLDKNSVVSKANLDGTITYVNDAFERLTSYSKEEIIGKKHSILKHPDSSKNKFKKLWELIKSGNDWQGIMKNKDKYGNTYYNSTLIVPIKDSKGKTIEYISSGTDITNIYRLQEEKEKSFLYDELTGLKNKNSLNIDLKEKIGTLILFDIIDFNNMNTLLGFEGANEILEEMAKIIQDKSNYVYRLNADTFGIFYENISMEKVQRYVLELLMEIDKYNFSHKEIEIPVSVHVGASNIKPYLKTAEIAVIENKKNFNKVSIYNEKMNDREIAEKNFLMLKKVKSALQEDNIKPFFQPIVDLNTKKPVKYEALVRLIDNDKIISPYFFLDISMKSKLYPSITKTVFKKSIEFVRLNNSEVSINISYQDIIDSDVLNYISISLQANEDISNMLTFEILESSEINDYKILDNFIKMIRKNGSKIAIDDFGSGYSNFTQILNLQPDIIKLDGSLIKNINTDKKSRDIVESIMILTKKENIKTVAEFIDNEQVHETVKNMGIDYGQGFFYSPPQDLLK